MQKNLIVAVVITAVVAGGGGYFLGTKNASAGVGNRGTQGQFAQGQLGGGQFGGRTGGNRFGGGFVTGAILSKDANSITVALRTPGGQTDQNNGASGSKIVFVGSSTEVMKAAQGSLSDLNVGDQITVTGTANSDGSITAQTVQLRPQMERPMTSTSTQGQ